MNSVQDYLKLLREKGYRRTALRESLLSLLLTSQASLTVADILDYSEIKKLNPNKTSIYREIESLITAGVIEEILTPDKSKSYKLSTQGHHHHLICENCNFTECIETKKLEDVLENITPVVSAENKFRVRSHELVLYGICQRCELAKN